MKPSATHTATVQHFPIVVTAGGTGGHFFPAQALIHELSTRHYSVILITDRRTKNVRVPVPVYHVMSGTFGRGLITLLITPFCLVFGIVQATFLLYRLHPAVLVGFGGYPSIPAVVAAYFLRIPVILHEQNRLLGRANRALAFCARCIATSFRQLQNSNRRFATKLKVTGNPIRLNLQTIDVGMYHPPTQQEPIHLVIFGGSQGARIFSDYVPAALSSLTPDVRHRLHVAQQTRPEDVTRVQETLAKTHIDADVSPFFEDILERLAASHLIIARAGASTIAEISVLGRPSILVPYPYALDDHQNVNAQALVEIGAAVVIQESCLTVPLLSRTIQELVTDPLRLRTMASAARTIGYADAVQRLADLVLKEVPNPNTKMSHSPS